MYAKNIDAFRAVHQELPADYEILTEQYGSYKKIVINFGKQRLLKEISRPNIGQMKIYQCEDYIIDKTTKFTLNEYIKNRDKIFADYNPGGKLVTDYEIPTKGLTYAEYKKTRGRSSGDIIRQYFLNGRIIS